MTNYEKSVYRAKQAFQWAWRLALVACLLGSIIGLLIAPIQMHIEYLFSGGWFGFWSGLFTGAFIPGIICIWHMFLHMLGQVSNAIRNGS